MWQNSKKYFFKKPLDFIFFTAHFVTVRLKIIKQMQLIEISGVGESSENLESVTPL